MHQFTHRQGTICKIVLRYQHEPAICLRSRLEKQSEKVPNYFWPRMKDAHLSLFLGKKRAITLLIF